MRRLAAIAAFALVLACSDDDGGGGEAAEPDPSPSTTSMTTTSTTGVPETTATTVGATTTITIDAADCAPSAASSPATYDDAGGVYAALVTGVDTAGRTLEFDVVQWLVGDDAIAAYEAETGDPTGPPNDYFVANENEQVREAAVADDVLVRLVRLSEDSDADLDDGAFEELETYAAATPSIYWLTVDAGTIVAVCEQYTP